MLSMEYHRFVVSILVLYIVLGCSSIISIHAFTIQSILSNTSSGRQNTVNYPINIPSFIIDNHRRNRRHYQSLGCNNLKFKIQKIVGKINICSMVNESQEESTSSSSSTANDSVQLSPTELIIANEKVLDPSTRIIVEAAAAAKQKQIDATADNQSSNSYPIDLPSPILLASCMISAIISTGCLFELFSSSDPSSSSLGFGPTLLLALAGVPLSLFLLYAAITKATAETEADDQAFLSGK